jgi:hypothetical protein
LIIHSLPTFQNPKKLIAESCMTKYSIQQIQNAFIPCENISVAGINRSKTHRSAHTPIHLHRSHPDTRHPVSIALTPEKTVNEYPALISGIYMSSQIPDVSKPGINTKSRPVVRSSYSQQRRGSYIPAGTLTHGVSMGSRRSPLEGIESRKSDSALLWVVVCLEESLT